ncbi:hypothetical protein BKA65DRAFT_154825 [Rhexocercosporidium sp. MPI-PUGE-AT-0058]|nr:hypothetical protein BKA65DRAFT_154825 [Rhexocercosporidium sp. MPI-PUGE-AT-0058]
MLSSTIPSALTASTLQQSLAPSTALLRSTGSLPRRPRPHQQVRNFRLNLWSSYLDPTFQKEIRRRYRRVEKHRHIEALNRKLSWERHFPINGHAGLKGFMCSAWRGHDSRPGGRWVNVDDIKSAKETPGVNSEETHDGVDKSRLENFMNNREALYDFIRARSRIFGHGWTSTTSVPNKSAPDSNSDATSSPSSHGFTNSTTYGKEGFRKRFRQHEEKTAEPEYEIDPITNRRIHKESQNPTRTDQIPVKTFQGYRSHFQEFEPPTSTTELASPEILQSLKDRLKGYRRAGVKQNENPDPVEEGLKTYDEKVDYESRRFYDCTGIAVDYSDPVQNGLKDYDNKISDGKACPDSNVKMTKNVNPVQDGLAEYDIKAGYRQGRRSEEPQEPEQQPEQHDPVTKAIKDYESRTEQPVVVRSSVAKSDQLDPVQQAMREYESCDFYKQARKKKQAEILLNAIQDYEANYQHLPTKLTGGRLNPEKLNPVLEAIQEYENTVLDEMLKSGRSQEPLDPILKAFWEYKAAPQRRQSESKSPDAAPNQLDRLLQSIGEHKSAVLQRAAVEITPPQKCPVQEGLEEYDAKVNNYEKPTKSGRRTVTSLAFASTPSDDTKLRGISNETTEDLDLLRTSDVRAASGIIKSPAKETESQKNAKRRELEQDFEHFQDVKPSVDEADAADKVHASRKLAEELRIEHSELLNHAAHARGRIDAKIAEVEAGWKPEESEQKKMTGNFVRDFPEEFEAKWTTMETDTEGLTSKSNGKESGTDPLVSLPPESFSRTPGTPRMETSLDRITSQKTDSGVAGARDQVIPAVELGQKQDNSKKDRHARRDKRLKERDLVREVRGIYEDAYGTIDSKHRQVPVPEAANVESETQSSTAGGQTLDSFANTPEPTLYKILAYDPTMQSVSTAETTSIVPDSSDSLTPAEVLLRLSNPSKFFPHFQSLQSQGYEIVAGSGDVLVFRKVRSGAPILPKVDTPAEAHEKAVSQERRRMTNPIDGMQSTPITGDFASPTGFVNYDLPRGSEAPFKSNIDMRREEPVFSGRRNWEDETEEERPKAKGRGKRLLVGAAWVAACSYAVGVVSEFFRTGGMDGKGPQGF